MTDKATTQTDSVPNEPERLLRDARLAQALRHMPDAHMQPGAQTRLAVLRHAQEALAASAGSAAEAPVQTRRWWQSTSPTAWGGALASVLVASFITLMWYGQPVPDANPEGLPAAQEAAAPAAPPAAPPALALPSPAPASPPATAMAKAKREEPRATALPQQNDLKETRKPAAPKAAEAPPPPFIPPPEVQVQAMAAPPPAPAPIAPPAVARMSAAPVNERAATSAVAGASVAGRVQRDRAEAPQSASTTVLQNGKTSRLSNSQSTALLSALRALPYGLADAYLQDDTDSSTFTVQSAQGEVWIVGPHRVQMKRAQLSVEATQKSQSTMSPITDAQWQELRSLALPAP